MFEEKEKLHRQERKLIAKLKVWNIYKVISGAIYKIFSYNKKFLVSPKSTLAIISVTVGTVLWKKVGYIDDFIVHRKARGKGIGGKLFTKALDKIEKQDSEYAFLVSRNERKASHAMYRKFGFVVVSMGVGVLAYKKLKKKDKKLSIFKNKSGK